MVCRGDVHPEKLPPTNRAAYFHGLRVFFQIRQWSLSEDELNFLDWGWAVKDSRLVPITTDLDIAPPELKCIIRCSCKPHQKNACGSKKCTCRKNGLECLPTCTGCRGENCSNVSKYIYKLKF